MDVLLAMPAFYCEASIKGEKMALNEWTQQAVWLLDLED